MAGPLGFGHLIQPFVAMSLLLKRRTSFRSACAGLALVLVSAGTAAAEPDFTSQLTTAISKKIERKGLSVIVGIRRIGAKSHFREFGAFRDDGLPPQATQVDLGSDTKLLTATLVLKQIETGGLDLDATLGDLLDGVPTDKQAITLRQVLTHRAGLPDEIGFDEEKVDRNTFLSRLFRTPLSNPPGTHYAYSNTGYSLLAAILEKKTGQPFDALIAETFYPNAEAPGIGYELAYREEASALSGRIWLTLYQKLPIRRASWGGTPVGWNLMGNGGAVATPDSFLTYLDDLFSGRLVSLQLLQEGFVHGSNIPVPKSYGFGIVRLENGNGDIVYTHSGANLAFSADWRFYPDLQLLIFIAGLEDQALDAMDLAISSVADLRGG